MQHPSSESYVAIFLVNHTQNSPPANTMESCSTASVEREDYVETNVLACT
jgi:hypothetical protein